MASAVDPVAPTVRAQPSPERPPIAAPVDPPPAVSAPVSARRPALRGAPVWARSRVTIRLLAVGALFAAYRGCSWSRLPEKSLAGLTGALGAAAHVSVQAQDLTWEPSDGVLSDFFWGRRILFLGAERVGAPRDLYRARVRLTPEGRPLAVCDVVNLTSTPEGDDHTLVHDTSAQRVAFATSAYGKLQGITALDLRGSARAEQATTTADRWMLAVTNLQETGEARGIARIQVGLDPDALSAQLAFSGPILVARVAFTSGVRDAQIDLDRAQVITRTDGVRADLLVRVPKKAIHWAVDTARAVPWIGSEPIAWLEAKVWEWKDRFRRLSHDLHGAQPSDEVKADVEQVAPRAIDPTAAGVDGGYWPPQPVPTIYRTPEPGEGVWEAVERPWMHALPGAPPAFYRTFVRPDPLRPFSKIVLVAMDTRQLDFDMEAGVDDPKPTVGSFHGTGRLPRELGVAKRAVAAWNGGFKTEHGHYGMMLRERVLLPPVPHAGTAVVMRDGRFGMGAWGPTRDLPPDVLSMRQNMDPLVDDGLFNPRNRGTWGAVLANQPKMVGQQTERSGLCITKARHLLYVWGDDVGADALGKAMLLAGCDFGIHLDMNPYHTGFVFMSFSDAHFKDGHSEVLTPLMAIGPRRYIDYNPKDFFYALVRDPAPAPFMSAAGTPVVWQPDGGVQPPPSWLPAIFRAETDGTSMTMFEPGRVRWTRCAGVNDVEAKAESRELDGEDAKRAIAAIMVGNDTGKAARWAGLSGRRVPEVVPEGESAVVIRPEGGLALLGSGEKVGSALDVLVATPLVEEGQPVDHAPHGRERHHDGMLLALGVTREGRIIMARATADTPLASVHRNLVSAGVLRAVLVPTPANADLARAGTPTPPMTGYPHAVIYAIAQPMLPRAFRYDRTEGGQPRWPVVHSPVP